MVNFTAVLNVYSLGFNPLTMSSKSTKKGVKAVGDFITKMVEVVEKKKQGYIREMIASMRVQSEIIGRARKDGVNIQEILPEIKKAYDLQSNPPSDA